MRKSGLIRGGNLDNAIVLGDFNVVNPHGLRFKDEFVRHKILDTIGDFSLLGCQLKGKITSIKSGHNLHHQLCQMILSDQNNYTVK